jgi:hypothetical protein
MVEVAFPTVVAGVGRCQPTAGCLPTHALRFGYCTVPKPFKHVGSCCVMLAGMAGWHQVSVTEVTQFQIGDEL